MKKFCCLFLVFFVFCSIPAIAKEQHLGLLDSKSPALCAKVPQTEMIVSVSPVRQSLQILSSSLLVVGAGIDAVVNEQYRHRILDALANYDAGNIFEKCLHERIHNALPQELTTVAPLSSTAGFHNLQAAEKARWESIAKEGHDTLLDLRMTYGIFGYEGILVTKLEGRLLELPGGQRIWRNALVVSSEPVLASDKLSDPTKQLGPNLSSPRLTVDEEAVARWTNDGGKLLKQRYKQAVEGIVSALLCDLGLAKEAIGEYYLGKNEMNRKHFDKADGHFRNALELDPKLIDAQNARSVNLARTKQLDDAIALARSITESHPDYGPAWFNLAWWYAVNKHDAAQAKGFYEKARALGMPEEKKIVKALE